MTYESLNDALNECVKAAGGSKTVGYAIWPAKGVENAQRHLLACLNVDRAEKLGLDELVLVMRLARGRGCHAAMQYLAQELSYAEPQPVSMKDQADELQRKFIEATTQLQAMAEEIKRLNQGSHLREVA